MENVFWPRIPNSLAGQWRLKDSQQNVTLEFSRDGAFTARATVAGKEGVVQARAQIDDANEKALHIISVNPQTNQEVKKSHIIHAALPKSSWSWRIPPESCPRFVRVE